MRRISTILLFLLLATTLKAQNLVSTDPYKRNVIIEEYTGVYCGYCPDGHKIANELAAEYQDRLFVLNIHAGGYANDASIDFRTEDGNIILVDYKTDFIEEGNENVLVERYKKQMQLYCRCTYFPVCTDLLYCQILIYER